MTIRTKAELKRARELRNWRTLHPVEVAAEKRRIWISKNRIK